MAGVGARDPVVEPEAEAHAEADAELEHEVLPVALLLEHPRDRLRAHQPDAVDRAAARQRRVDAGHRPGVARPAGGRDLGAPPFAGARLGGVDEAAEERAAGDRLGIELLVGQVDDRRDQLGDTVVLGGREADVEVGAERARDLVAEEGADRAAVDAPQDLALDVALGHGVVARRRTRFPPRRLGGQALDDGVPVVEGLGRDRRVEAATPAVWLITCRTSTPSLPFWPNSGQ